MKYLFAFLLSTATAFSQSTTNSSIQSFTNPAIWDISGSYERTEGAKTSSYNLALLADGQIVGTATETYENGDNSLQGSAFISGRLMGKSGAIRFLDSWRGTSTGTINGRNVQALVRHHETAFLVPASETIETSSKSRVCIRGGNCSTTLDGFSEPLPPSMDGSWSLAMNVIKDDFVLSGQATLTLSNDRTFLYAITGRYNQNQDTAKLRLKGQDEAAKTSLILSTTTTNFVVTSITGSVLGQNLKFDSR